VVLFELDVLLASHNTLLVEEAINCNTIPEKSKVKKRVE
jgi:hypothetical protein